jgi:hypothetical protein
MLSHTHVNWRLYESDHLLPTLVDECVDIIHIFMLDWITSLRTHRMNQPQLSIFSSFTIPNARGRSLFSTSYPHAINNLPL